MDLVQGIPELSSLRTNWRLFNLVKLSYNHVLISIPRIRKNYRYSPANVTRIEYTTCICRGIDQRLNPWRSWHSHPTNSLCHNLYCSTWPDMQHLATRAWRMMNPRNTILACMSLLEPNSCRETLSHARTTLQHFQMPSPPKNSNTQE